MTKLALKVFAKTEQRQRLYKPVFNKYSSRQILIKHALSEVQLTDSRRGYLFPQANNSVFSINLGLHWFIRTIPICIFLITYNIGRFSVHVNTLSTNEVMLVWLFVFQSSVRLRSGHKTNLGPVNRTMASISFIVYRARHSSRFTQLTSKCISFYPSAKKEEPPSGINP